MDLQQLVRPNIWNLRPYSSARNEFTGNARVFIDANESPFNEPYNRYPDPLQQKLKLRLSEVKGVQPQQIFLGVGSDECIDLVYRIFCEPAVDNVVAISPSYGMYEVCANINNVEYRTVSLHENFELDPGRLLAATDEHTKAIWLCSPNNPTGNAFDPDMLADVCRRFTGIVAIDEAYVNFSERGSMLRRLADLPNLIVMQTFSKAMASASVRLGMAFASKEIIGLFNKVKYPYNINLLTQRYALDLLDRIGDITDEVAQIIACRQVLADELKQLRCVQRVYRSDANFLLVRVDDADGLYEYLLERGIVVRNRNRVPGCRGCLRFTVGNTSDNEMLINTLKDYDNRQ